MMPPCTGTATGLKPGLGPALATGEKARQLQMTRSEGIRFIVFIFFIFLPFLIEMSFTFILLAVGPLADRQSLLCHLIKAESADKPGHFF
jgi:hypothetical protein